MSDKTCKTCAHRVGAVCYRNPPRDGDHDVAESTRACGEYTARLDTRPAICGVCQVEDCGKAWQPTEDGEPRASCDHYRPATPTAEPGYEECDRCPPSGGDPDYGIDCGECKCRTCAARDVTCALNRDDARDCAGPTAEPTDDDWHAKHERSKAAALRRATPTAEPAPSRERQCDICADGEWCCCFRKPDDKMWGDCEGCPPDRECGPDALLYAGDGMAAAAEAYDKAMESCGNDPGKMASFCTAEGDDLDTLWMALIAAILDWRRLRKVTP